MSARDPAPRDEREPLPHRQHGEHPPTIPSTVAVLQHPIHPMLVVYPISFLSTLLATDVAYWLTGVEFWALCSFWLVLGGFSVAVLAGMVGMVDFFTMGQVRRHVSSWNHFMCGILVISLSGANLLLRFDDPVGAALPWGLFMSAVLMPVVAITGWLGGTLTFRHSIGTFSKKIDEPNDLDGDGRRPGD